MNIKPMRVLVGLILSLIASLAAADEPHHITYTGGDGSSEAKAIIINGAGSDAAATHSEYVYLAQHFPKYKMSKQWLLTGDKKYYDKLEFVASDGTTHLIFFDITESFVEFEKEFKNK